MVMPDYDIAQHLKYVPDACGTVRALGIDKYPGEMAIMRELVQNADDAFDKKNSPTYVKFILTEDELIIEHDGKPFSKPPEGEEKYEEITKYDFAKISKIGLGKNDEEMTGKFGTGFTSVFYLSDNPRIESNGWDFQICIGEDPIIKEIPYNPLTFIHLPIRLTNTKISAKIGAEIFDENKRKCFEEQILAESYKIIFFLKHITNIEVFKNEKPLYIVEKIKQKKRTKTKNLLCENITISIQNFQDKNWKYPKEKWWIYSLENIPIPSEFEELGLKLKQKVSIAINKGESNFAKMFNIPNHSYFTFPVKETKFHFKYNASRFFLTTGRDDFITKEGLKNDWNRWQINNLTDLLIKIVSEFILTKKSPDRVYHILPHSHEHYHEYDKYLLDGFREKVKEKNIKIFYTTKGKWVGPQNTYIGDKKLEQILPKNQYRYFIAKKFVRNYKGVLEFYGAKSLSHGDLVEYLEENQNTNSFEKRFNSKLTKRKIERLRLIYEYLGESDLSSDVVRKLKEIRFILTEDGTLRHANYMVYFPPDENMPLINCDDRVHHSLYTTKKAKSFLQNSLKIAKMGLHDLIIDSFLRRDYNKQQKFDFISYLVKRKEEVMKREETIDELRNKSKDILKLEIDNPEDPEIYFHDKEVKQIFGNSLNYLSREYEQELGRQNLKWKDFFKIIGVKEIPTPKKIIGIADEIYQGEFSKRSALKAEKLFRFISKNLRNFDKEEKKELEYLKYHKWIPTIRNEIEYSDETYIDRKITHLVGSEVPLISFSVKKSDPLVRFLEMQTKPSMEDVVNYLLGHNVEVNKVEDRKVDFRIYKYLTDNVEDLDDELIEKLQNSRVIWFNGKLWGPHKLFLKNYSREFGPNGEIRGYLHKSKFKELTNLCSKLGIKEKIEEPDDYVDFLLDISEQAERIEVAKWRKYIENAYGRTAYSEDLLSEKQKESLSESRIIIHNSYLKQPIECYLIRKTDKIYKDRIEKSGIMDVPFILESDPKKESFYLSIGMKEVYDHVFQERIDENNSEPYPDWIKKLDELIPWVNGYGYRALGNEGIASHHKLKEINVQRVSGLKVLYGIEYDSRKITGNPLEDFCCLQTDNSEKSVLYLDDSFDERNNEHISFVTTLLVSLMDPAIGLERLHWNLVISSYLRLGEVPGINPYSPAQDKEDIEEMELEETSTEIEEETEEEYEDEEEKVEERPSKEEEITKEWVEKEKWPGEEKETDEVKGEEKPEEKKRLKDWTPKFTLEQITAIKVEEYEPKEVPRSSSRGVNKRVKNHSQSDTNLFPTPSSVDALSRDAKKAIGNRGEEIALKQLKEEKSEEYSDVNVIDKDDGFVIEKDGEILVKVIWLNKNDDRGVGYDIELIENDITNYIEVKSTITEKKDWFEVSRAQWELMQKVGNNFWIYRVYNIEAKTPKLTKIRNPAKLWQEGNITAYPIRIQI